MKTARTFAWKRIGLVGTVALVALLGNMRTAVSGATAPGRMPTLATAAERAPMQTDAEAAGFVGVMDVDDGSIAARRPAEQKEDDAHLVPAIYAWDPDVRFVYYRHVSKWM